MITALGYKPGISGSLSEFIANTTNRNMFAPVIGQISWNNAVLTASTQIMISSIDALNGSRDYYWRFIATPFLFNVQTSANGSQQTWTVTKVLNISGGFVMNTTLLESGGTIASNDLVGVRVIAGNVPTGGTAGQVLTATGNISEAVNPYQWANAGLGTVTSVAIANTVDITTTGSRDHYGRNFQYWAFQYNRNRRNIY